MLPLKPVLLALQKCRTGLFCNYYHIANLKRNFFFQVLGFWHCFLDFQAGFGIFCFVPCHTEFSVLGQGSQMPRLARQW